MEKHQALAIAEERYDEADALQQKCIELKTELKRKEFLQKQKKYEDYRLELDQLHSFVVQLEACAVSYKNLTKVQEDLLRDCVEKHTILIEQDEEKSLTVRERVQRKIARIDADLEQCRLEHVRYYCCFTLSGSTPWSPYGRDH